MKRREIERRFDDIVEFSGVERFIDTPVKRYSSGMYVRLAFAVAAHLEPEILFVDEVLSVGDAEFQRRCLGRMEELANTGRTVVFVSHALPAVAQLCDRAIWIDGGRLVGDGGAAEVIAQLPPSDPRPAGTERAWAEESAPGNDLASIRAIRVVARGREAAGSRRRAQADRRRDRVRRCWAAASRSSRRSRCSTRRARSPSTRWTPTRAGTGRRRPATTSRPRGSPGTC